MERRIHQHRGRETSLRGGDERLKHMEQVVLKPQNLPEQLRLLADGPPAQGHPSIIDIFTHAYESDPLPEEILNAIRANDSIKDITVVECMEQDGSIQYRGKCYLPEHDQLRPQLIQDHHDTALAGHPGRAKMFDLLLSVTAPLHVTCLGPGDTSFIHSRLATTLRSLAIILLTLPLYYSTVLTSTCAIVSTHIHSYEAIHGRMPLHDYCSLISDIFRILDCMNYPVPTCLDTQITHEISYSFGSTDCISEVSRYVCWIEVNGNRDDVVRIPEANRQETRRNTYEWEIIRTCDLRIADTQEAWIVHPIEVNSSTDNSELIPEANRPGDASTTKSIKVHFNGCIQELEGYQSRHE